MNAGMAVGAVVIGIASGVLSGMLGVGGGVLMVPGMVLLLGMGQHVAEGTSLLVIIPTAVVGAATHWRSGYVLLLAAALLGAGGIVGAVIGSHIALAVSASTLRVIFAAYLVITGVRIVLPARPRRREESS